jgi:hypothetical protein
VASEPRPDVTAVRPGLARDLRPVIVAAASGEPEPDAAPTARLRALLQMLVL